MNCSYGSLNYSHGFLEPNCENCRTDLCPPGGPSTGEPAMGEPAIQAMGVQPTRLGFLEPNCGNCHTDCGPPGGPSSDSEMGMGARSADLASSTQAYLLVALTTQELVEKTSARASAKISARRHRCCCHCCERASAHPSCRIWAPIPNSHCLAFQDVRETDVRKNCSVDSPGAIQQFCSVQSSVLVGRSAGTHYRAPPHQTLRF